MKQNKKESRERVSKRKKDVGTETNITIFIMVSYTAVVSTYLLLDLLSSLTRKLVACMEWTQWAQESYVLFTSICISEHGYSDINAITICPYGSVQTCTHTEHKMPRVWVWCHYNWHRLLKWRVLAVDFSLHLVENSIFSKCSPGLDVDLIIFLCYI